MKPNHKPLSKNLHRCENSLCAYKEKPAECSKMEDCVTKGTFYFVLLAPTLAQEVGLYLLIVEVSESKRPCFVRHVTYRSLYSF